MNDIFGAKTRFRQNFALFNGGEIFKFLYRYIVSTHDKRNKIFVFYYHKSLHMLCTIFYIIYDIKWNRISEPKLLVGSENITHIIIINALYAKTMS